MEKKLNELSVSELKALAYDLIANRQQVEQQLNVVNNMIAEKSNAEVQKEEEKPIDPEKVVDKK